MSATLALDHNVAPLVHSEPFLSAQNRAYKKWFIDQEAANDALDLVDNRTQGQPIHMNGRVFDPEIARFLSADPFIQAPGNLQSYNRYSYVLNNPLAYTDPSGYFFKKLVKRIKKTFKSIQKAWHKHWRTVVAVGLAAVGGWAVYGAVYGSSMAAGIASAGGAYFGPT